MALSRYDEDLDSGDISLSLPSSRSSPQLSSLLYPSSRIPSRYDDDTNRNVAGPSRPREMSSPTPKRLLGKDLWPSPAVTTFAGDETTRSTSAPMRTTSPETMAPPTAHQTYKQQISVNGGTNVSRSRSLHGRNPPAERVNGNGPSSSRTPSMRVGWHRRPGDPRPPPIVSEDVGDRMGRWVKEIVVCNFDLERGPVVERRIMGRRWGPGEKENV